MHVVLETTPLHGINLQLERTTQHFGGPSSLSSRTCNHIGLASLTENATLFELKTNATPCSSLFYALLLLCGIAVI